MRDEHVVHGSLAADRVPVSGQRADHHVVECGDDAAGEGEYRIDGGAERDWEFSVSFFNARVAADVFVEWGVV